MSELMEQRTALAEAVERAIETMEDAERELALSREGGDEAQSLSESEEVWAWAKKMLEEQTEKLATFDLSISLGVDLPQREDAAEAAEAAEEEE